MKEKEIMQKLYIPNEEEYFIDSLREAIKNRNEYYTDFTVNYKRVNKIPFETLSIEEFKDLEVFCFSNTVFHISYDENLNDDIFDGKIDVYEFEEFYEEVKRIV